MITSVRVTMASSLSMEHARPADARMVRLRAARTVMGVSKEKLRQFTPAPATPATWPRQGHARRFGHATSARTTVLLTLCATTKPLVSTSCTCTSGYEGDGRTGGNSTGCTDIDGCATSPCFAGVSCTDNA
eukprot:SAG22_NODE_11659_length_475_cov_0.821809_1_plen_130_part_01